VTTGATAFSEFITVVGTQNAPPLNYAWPTGSSVLTGIQSSDSAFSTLVSSDLSAWTSSGAGTWVAVVDNPRSSAYATQTCYAITAAGAGVTYVQYPVAQALAPGSYAWTCFIKGSSGALTDALTVKLVDSQGNVLATLATYTSYSGAWQQKTGIFNYTINPPMTPPVGQLYLRFTFTATGAASVRFAFPGFSSATPLYSGGPVMWIWSGSTPLGLADYWVATSTRSTSETVSLFRGLERFFGLSSFSPQIAIPTASPGTYTNALVV